MTKKELRTIYLDKRLALSAEERKKKSAVLCSAFFEHLDLSQVRCLHTYLPLERKHEPDTWIIIDEVQKHFPSIKIVLPRINPKVNGLESLSFKDRQSLQLNALGISEPSVGEAVDPSLIDLAIVPLIIFDSTGHRVGYGKGFYDRFLSACDSRCLIVGLSYFEPVNEIVDVSETDVRLTHGITPKNFYAFKQQAPVD